MQPFTGVLPITAQAGVTGGSVLVGGWGHQSADFLLGCRKEPQSQQGLRWEWEEQQNQRVFRFPPRRKGKGQCWRAETHSGLSCEA